MANRYNFPVFFKLFVQYRGFGCTEKCRGETWQTQRRGKVETGSAQGGDTEPDPAGVPKTKIAEKFKTTNPESA